MNNATLTHRRLTAAPPRRPDAPLVKVLRLTPSEDTGNLLAFADVEVGGFLTVRMCRLVQAPDSRAYVSPPTHTWEDETGKTNYRPLLSWPDTWKRAITESVWSAWNLCREQAEGGWLE